MGPYSAVAMIGEMSAATDGLLNLIVFSRLGFLSQDPCYKAVCGRHVLMCMCIHALCIRPVF